MSGAPRGGKSADYFSYAIQKRKNPRNQWILTYRTTMPDLLPAFPTKVQWEPENSGIKCRLLDSNYDFNYSLMNTNRAA